MPPNVDSTNTARFNGSMDWFAQHLVDWWSVHGRKDLPWQIDRTAYRVWVSEIMLQQTQVSTVIPYYERFLVQFPDVTALAEADEDSVLNLWTGLGYYSRARNLRAAAIAIVSSFNGEFPRSTDELVTLPGIGPSTAGAIAAIAFKQRAPILDGNVRRVLSRFHAVDGEPAKAETQAMLWEHAQAHTPSRSVDKYTQAIMDLGATLCTRRNPACTRCPVAGRCDAFAAGDPTAYPPPRPRKTNPSRSARMFVLVDSAGACLLEKRPPAGVWASLWSPPERSADLDVAAFLTSLEVPSREVVRHHTGPSFRHSFTHFHLDIEPVYAYLNSPQPCSVADGTQRWHVPGDETDFGLSAVAIRLLDSITQTPLFCAEGSRDQKQRY